MARPDDLVRLERRLVDDLRTHLLRSARSGDQEAARMARSLVSQAAQSDLADDLGETAPAPVAAPRLVRAVE
jgi:hypothetical protein